MSKYSLILILALTAIDFCNGYEYQKPELRFDAEDIKLLRSSSLAKRRIVRGVFFYTYDDNLSGREIEMHELSLSTFNKLISSKDFTKSPATVKSTFDLVSFFDGRCEATISCERKKEECTSIECNCLTTPVPSITPRSIINTTPLNETETSFSNTKRREKFSDTFISYAKELKLKKDYKLIKNELKIVDEYTVLWTTPQVKEFLKPIFNFIRGELQKTTESAIQEQIKNIVFTTANNIDPIMGLDARTGIINAVLKVIRDVSNVPATESTTPSYIGNVVKSNSKPSTTTRTTTKTTKVTSTTRIPSTTRSSPTTKTLTTSTTTKRPPVKILSTPSTTPKPSVPTTTTTTRPPVKILTTTTPKTTPKTTSRVTTTTKTTTPSTTTSTSTTKRSSTTKTYIPPLGSSQKPYTRWVGSYRKYSGYYSFGYSWKPFTGGLSWRTRRFSTGTTTTTARYQQDNLENSLNPLENSV